MTHPRTTQDQSSYEEAQEFRRDMEQSAWLYRNVRGFRPGVDYDEKPTEEEEDETL